MERRIVVLGAGYVGLTAAACFADRGHVVHCVDVDAARIEFLRFGVLPIHEPALEAVAARALRAGRLNFTTDISAARDADVAFIAVGTPESENGAADIGAVLAAAESVGRVAERELVLVVKSTAPVGTCMAAVRRARTVARVPIHPCANPEFLREGSAADDFLHPARVVLGTDSDHARSVMAELYAPFVETTGRLLFMDVASAELTKYAANSMLATRITLMNEIANLCERVGADVEHVRRGVGADDRIGPAFLQAGPGYGGACFPKDVKALIRTAEAHGLPMSVLQGVDDANARQQRVLFAKLRDALDDRAIALGEARVGVWGLAFKAQTDDLRGSPAIVLVDALLASGATVVAHDPVAMPHAGRIYADAIAAGRLVLAPNAMSCARDAHALVVVTEWSEYRAVDAVDVANALACRIVVDGRAVFDPLVASAAGLDYHAIGRARGRSAQTVAGLSA